MPGAELSTFNLEGKDGAELEARRRHLVSEMNTKYKGYDDPEVPLDLLNELSVITGALRSKTAKPPARAKGAPKPTKVSAVSVDDIAKLL